LSSWLNYIHLFSFKVVTVSETVVGNAISFQVIVLSLILDNHVCVYDVDIYRVLTLKNEKSNYLNVCV